MNRRDFLRNLTITAAALTASGSARTARSSSPKDAEQILATADERIDKHRKAGAVIKLVGPDGKPLKPGQTVKIAQRRHKFLFGCNIFKLARCKTETDNAAYADRFAELLNFATLPFYWWNYEREKGKPDDARTDEIVRWCKAHDITTKGHPLAWNWAEQNWLPDDPTEVMALQLKRIERCASRFKGDIDIWDVVNEATHYDRSNATKNAPKLTAAIAKMGVAAYIRAAFNAARTANPNATLLINDYRTDPLYEEKVISKLVDNNRQPLYDVIGIQSHMHTRYWGAPRVWEVCEHFKKFAVPLHFTETTLISGPRSASGWLTTGDGEKQQAEHVPELYTILFSHPAVEAITWWDFTDQNAWQQAPAGLVRADMTPKPAYDRLKDLIKRKWWTQTESVVAIDGKAAFRGFLGKYTVTATIAGRSLTAAFNLEKTTKKAIQVRLN